MQLVRITRGVFGISAKRLATEARVSERELQRIELGTVGSAHFGVRVGTGFLFDFQLVHGGGN